MDEKGNSISNPLLNPKVLKVLVKYMKKSDLKTHRLVCKSWQDAVTPRYRNEYSPYTFLRLIKWNYFPHFLTTIKKSRVNFFNFIICETSLLDNPLFHEFFQIAGKALTRIAILGPFSLKESNLTKFRQVLLNVTNLKKLQIMDSGTDENYQMALKYQKRPNQKLFPEPVELPSIEELEFFVGSKSALHQDFITDLFQAIINLKVFSIAFETTVDEANFCCNPPSLSMINLHHNLMKTLQSSNRFLTLTELEICGVARHTLEILIEMSEAGMKLKILNIKLSMSDLEDKRSTPAPSDLLEHFLSLQRISLESLDLKSQDFDARTDGADGTFRFKFPCFPNLKEFGIGHGQYDLIPEPVCFADTFPALVEYSWISLISSDPYYLPNWYSQILNPSWKPCTSLQKLTVPPSVKSPQMIQDLGKTFPNLETIHMNIANGLLPDVVKAWKNLTILKLEFEAEVAQFSEAKFLGITDEEFKTIQGKLKRKIGPDLIKMERNGPSILDLKKLKYLYLRHIPITDMTGYFCLAKMDSLRALIYRPGVTRLAQVMSVQITKECYAYIKQRQPNFNYEVDDWSIGGLGCFADEAEEDYGDEEEYDSDA